MAVIRSVTLSGFRGAPHPLVVDFVDVGGDARSATIIGDNGTGKSTIVDAIEFCLQAKVGRLAGFNASTSPGIANYAAAATPSVTVEFADGSRSTRSAERDERGIVVADRSPHPEFRLAPVTIKRSDLLRFSSAAQTARLAQLLDFFGPSPVEAPLVPETDFRLFEDIRKTKKEERRSLAVRLAAKLNVDPAAVPLGQDFNGFVSRYGMVTAQSGKAQVRPDIAPLVRDIRNVSKEIGAIDKDIAQAMSRTRKELEGSLKFHPIREVLSNASETLTESFLAVAKDAFITEVTLEVSVESVASLQVLVSLPNGIRCSPARVLSEGKQDLLTLLLFTSLAREAARLGQPHLLILDDVLQSLSGEVRMRYAEYLVDTLSGWQLILTVHDRLWASQLRSVFQRGGVRVVEREIHSWSFDKGPKVSGRLKSLREATADSLVDAAPDLACTLAGRLLEEVADHASCELRTGVARKRGDRYTLGDTWPGVLKELRKSSLREVVEEVERWQPLRNLVGAHFNEWAAVLPLNEARSFAAAVLALDAGMRCESCGPLQGTGLSGLPLACRCGRLVVTRR